LLGGLFATGLPLKPTITPGCKMKQLYWAKVPNMLVPKAFWMKATDVSDKLNTMVLEDMFAMDETTPLQAGTSNIIMFQCNV
jgi:hypothetical protein